MGFRSILGSVAAAVAVSIASMAGAQGGSYEEMANAALHSIVTGQPEGWKAQWSTELRSQPQQAQFEALSFGIKKQLGEMKVSGKPKIESVPGEYVAVVMPLATDAGDAEGRFIYQSKVMGMRLTGVSVMVKGQPAPPMPPAIPPPAGSPPYVDATSFQEWPGKVDGLPAMMTMPKVASAESPVPAVVLVSPLGAVDMDAARGGTRLYKDLAQGLASQGIAALRFHKRNYMTPGVALTPGYLLEQETFADLRKAIAMARGTKGIDPKRIYVAGRGSGGLLAIEMATLDPEIAGVIALSPAADFSPAGMKRLLEKVEQLSAGTMQPQEAMLFAGFKGELDRAIGGGYADSDILFDASGAFWNDLKKRDVATLLPACKAPVAVFFPQRDFTLFDSDISNYEMLIAQNPGGSVKMYPELNGAFVATQGTPGPQESRTAGFADGAFVADVVAFVKGGK